MTWYKKALKNNFKEIFSSVYIYILTVVLLGVWYLISGQTFHWVWIEPLEVPPYQRIFYSALFFAGPGYILYRMKVYLVLFWLLDFRSFQKAKALILLVVSLFMYFKVVPWVIDLLNDIISIGYNILMFLIYVAPWFVVSVISFSTYLYFRKNNK